MKQSPKRSSTRREQPSREIRDMAAQGQIDAIMDSFDFSSAMRIAAEDSPEETMQERTLRQAARKVLHGAVENGGWATGGGFSAFLQEWRTQPGKGALKISLFYGPSSLLEPHTEFSEVEIRKITP